MLNNQKTTWILIVIITIAFLGVGWYFYQELFKNASDPLDLIPENTAAFIEINDLDQLKNALKGATTADKIFGDWPGTASFQEFLSDFKVIENKASNSESKIVITFQKNGILVLIDGSQYDFSSIKKISGIKLMEIEESNIGLYQISRNNKKLFFVSKNGIVYVSTQPELVSNAIARSNTSGYVSEIEDFQRLQKISGKRADAHIYLQYKYISNWLTISNSTDPLLTNIAKICNWTALDLNIKSTELMLNGYSIFSDTSNQFLQIFKNQESVGMTIVDNFPFETESYVHLSLSNYESFVRNWQSFMASGTYGNGFLKSAEKLNKAIGSDPNSLHEQWWAGEMAAINTKNGAKHAIFLSKSGRESFRVLSNLANLSQPKMLNFTYQNHKIKELNFDNLLFAHFGPWFNDFGKTYFTVIGEMVIFSNTLDDLKYYIDQLENGLILRKKESYNRFSDNLSNHLNYTYYVKSPKSVNAMWPLLDEKKNNEWAATSFFEKDLNAFSLQMNWKNGMIYTGIFAGTEKIEQKSESDWQIIFESNIVKGPYKVMDHTDNSHKYIVFDEYRQMYLIDQQGDIVWKKQLEEIPISDVFEIDYYKNGKIQYLFNSLNYIYLIDLTGAPVKAYPLKLNSEATNGLNLIDYNNDKNYRYLIAGKNGRVYNYTKDGSLLKDWNSKNTNKQIIKPIQHVVANSKDYLIAASIDGDAIMFDRKGAVRFEIRKSFENALGSDFYANRTNSKGMMITTDVKGQLIYIPEKGKVKKTSFGNFGPNHFFIYSDFTANGNYDFIFLEDKELIVFDRFKNTLLSYIFDNAITNKPQISVVSGRKILTVMDAVKKELYLFNSDGLQANQINASSGYILDQYKNQVFVLAASGKSLKKYPLPAFR
jgi:hypothetical protein